MLFFLLGLFVVSAYSQNTYIFSGKVTDTKNVTLPGASVYLPAIDKGEVTDSNGNFHMHVAKKGTYVVQVNFLGYETYTDTFEITAHTKLNVKLKALALSLQEVVVKDNYAESRKKEESLNIEVVNDKFIQQNMGGSLSESLERLPGVSIIGIGSGQSKPVIRGLGFNRVVVVENDIKHEGQQWGSDHGLEIDQFAANRIEVVKGPASLKYGSDAIGGVIDVKQSEIPAPNTIGGKVDMVGKSNNNLLGSSVNVFIRKNKLFADLRGTILDYGDYKVPTDSVSIYSYKAALKDHHLRNTAGKEQDLHLSFGLIQPGFQTRFFVSNVYTKSGFFANAHGLEPRNVDAAMHDKSSRDILYPYQSVNHSKLINKTIKTWDGFKLETDIGIQHNLRKEQSKYVSHGYMPAIFPDTLSMNPDVERKFDKYIYSANVKTSYYKLERLKIFAGFNTEYQDNNIGGRGFILPEYNLWTLGVHLVNKYTLSERSKLQAGIRFDHGKIETKEYYDWFPSLVEEGGIETDDYLQRADDLNKSYENITWSAGYVYNHQGVSIKANIGKSFRMPIAKELAANGVNYHRFSYEVGKADLDAEVSYQLDLEAEYSKKRFAIGATPFINYFPNYIYLNPSDKHDSQYGNGNQIFYYTQSSVFRYGGEVHSHWEVTPQIQLGLMGEYVYSEQVSGEKEGYTLPFSPPPSAIFSVKYQPHNFAWANNAYISMDYRVTGAQNHIVPPEEKTKGYQLCTLSTGADFQWGNQQINVSVSVQNVFDTKYYNHTSYYRLINVPEAGRNAVLKISIPFSAHMH